MQDLLAALVSFFLVQPLQNELSDKRAAAQAPAAVAAAVQTCAADAAPALVERGLADPWWAVSSTAGVWTGMTAPDALLIEVSPDCAPAIAAVRPYLSGDEA